MGALAHSARSLCSRSVILRWSQAMIEGLQRKLKWDLLSQTPGVKRQEKRGRGNGVTGIWKVKMESRGSKTERQRKGDRVFGMFSHICPLEGHQSSLSLLDVFLYIYHSVFLSVITSCHPLGDSSETLSGRAPLGFIKCLPLRFTTVQNDTHRGIRELENRLLCSSHSLDHKKMRGAPHILMQL